MEEEIKNLLNCGYYDECNDYIVELNEEKMKDFFHIFFKADKVIFANKDMEKLKKENQNLQEQVQCMKCGHHEEIQGLNEQIEKLKYDADKMAHEIIEEQSKKYNELKENSKILIKAFAEIL